MSYKRSKALTGEYGTLDYGKAYEQLWAVVKSQKLFTKGIESICVSYDDPKITETSLQRSEVSLSIHKPAHPEGEVSCKTLAGGKYAVFFYQGSYTHLSTVYDAAMCWVIRPGWPGLAEDGRVGDEPGRRRHLPGYSS